MVSLHSLRASAKRARPKRLGRGNATGKGTTAGRGTKGQRARTGGRNKLARRGLRALVERTPKTRGFTSRRQALQTVTVGQLDRAFTEGTLITPVQMERAKLIHRAKDGVKVLAGGSIRKKLTVKAQNFSKSAEAQIAKAGGTVVRLGQSSPSTTDSTHVG